MRATLLDLDPAALEYARVRLEPLLPDGRLQLVRENLSRLASRPAAAKSLGQPDFLCCTGLFDYLPDEEAVAMLQLFWSRLAPLGAILVFNFSPRNPSRAYMEWVGNWYLIYRSRRQIAQLARQAAVPAACCSVEAEPLGVNLLLHIRKP